MIAEKLRSDKILLGKQLSWLSISFEECKAIGLRVFTQLMSLVKHDNNMK